MDVNELSRQYRCFFRYDPRHNSTPEVGWTTSIDAISYYGTLPFQSETRPSNPIY